MIALTLSYQNDKNVLNTIRKGVYRQNVGINIKSCLLLVFFFIAWVLYILIHGLPINYNFGWVLKATLLTFIGHLLLTSLVGVPLYVLRVKRTIKKRNSPNLHCEIFNSDEIERQLLGTTFKFSYREITRIIFFSDVILVQSRFKLLTMYERDSFNNATEEEWLAFMKERNPKIKVKYLKNDYIRF